MFPCLYIQCICLAYIHTLTYVSNCNDKSMTSQISFSTYFLTCMYEGLSIAIGVNTCVCLSGIESEVDVYIYIYIYM